MTFPVLQHNVKAGVSPKRGDVVTFSYDDYSRRAVPVNPKIYRIRDDISWDTVVENFEQEIPQSITPPGMMFDFVIFIVKLTGRRCELYCSSVRILGC